MRKNCIDEKKDPEVLKRVGEGIGKQIAEKMKREENNKQSIVQSAPQVIALPPQSIPLQSQPIALPPPKKEIVVTSENYGEARTKQEDQFNSVSKYFLAEEETKQRVISFVISN